MYSNPPIHGAKIVANIVGDPTLFNEWKAEMEMMAGRIKNVRQKLYDSLSAKDKSGKDWSFILKQIGMFSFTGLNKAQVIASSQLLSKHTNFIRIKFLLSHI
jgi:aspartate aminotransferase